LAHPEARDVSAVAATLEENLRVILREKLPDALRGALKPVPLEDVV
jgi:hypothetical protein